MRSAKAGDILFDIDWQGARQLEPDFGEHLVTIFLLPPSMAELERRLRARGTNSPEVIADLFRRAAHPVGDTSGRIGAARAQPALELGHRRRQQENG